MAKSDKPTTIRVTWQDNLRFHAETPDSRSLDLDGDGQAATSPTEALLSSLGGCMAIDVVMILQKMRAGLEGLSVECAGHRNSEPPRFFTSVALHFQVEGSVSLDKLRRAIDLSFDKYCSVYHSLNPSMEVSYTTNLDPSGE